MIFSSNIALISNIHYLEDELHKDKNFRQQVRGRNALTVMLKEMSIQGEYIPDFRTESVSHLITPIQLQDFTSGLSCSLLKNDDELIYGYVLKDGALKKECKCYKIVCKHFHSCRPGADKELVLSKKIQIDNLLTEQGNGILKQDLEENVFYSKPDLWNTGAKLEPERTHQRANFETTHDDGSGELIIDFEFEMEHDAASEIIKDDTHERDKIIKNSTQTKMLVSAGPGTGKTHSLIEKIKYMASNYNIEPAVEMLVLCFTRTAVKEIKDRFFKAVKSEDVSDDLSYLNIRTFDSFATQLLMHMDIETDGRDYEERIELAIEAIEHEPEVLENLQHLFVDEIQDLVGARARLVRTMIKHTPGGFTLLGDPLQGIYDYQVKGSGDLSSEDFFSWVGVTYSGELERVSLTINKRQVRRLSNFSFKTRSLLEAEPVPDTVGFFQFVKNIPTAGKVQNLDLDFSKRTGILCRTNGEVLEVSSYLTKLNIPHQVKTKSTSNKLPFWIETLLEYEVIDLGVITSVNNQFKYWASSELEDVFKMLLTVVDDHREKIDMISLRDKLAKGWNLPDELYERKELGILVTTIHSSKGKEFDTVYFMESSMESNYHDEDWQEAKVYYVAITRAENQLLKIDPISNKRNFLRKSKSTGRWMKIKSIPKWSVNLVEVGTDYDISEESFVSQSFFDEVKENQEYIRYEVQQGNDLLLKLDNGSYGIYHSDRFIGNMSTRFSRELKDSLCDIYGKNMEWMPTTLEGLYVDQVYTIVRKPETLSLEVDDHYGSKGVWLAVQVIGMGNLRWTIQ